MNSITPQHFYVYTLTNSLDGQVFYVGKGTGNRIDIHEAEARRGIQTYKCHFIRQIWEQGGKVIKEKVYETPVEQDAYIYEWCLVQLIYGEDSLANICAGGNGGSVARQDIYKQVMISLSREVFDAIYHLERQTLTGFVRQVLQVALSENVEQILRKEHDCITKMGLIKPRTGAGMQLPLDIVLRLQDIPRNSRSAFIEFAVRRELGLL